MDRDGNFLRWRRRQILLSEKLPLWCGARGYQWIRCGKLKKINENVPISPATSASRPEKMIVHSRKWGSVGSHGWTMSSRTELGIGVVCFHEAALWYGLPADLDDAPRAWILNHGWEERRVMKRWPTVPVAPKMPTLILS